MTISINIPSDNKALAAAIGRALTEYGTGKTSADIKVTLDASEAVDHIQNAAASIEQITEAEVYAGNLAEQEDTAGKSQEQSTVGQGAGAAQGAPGTHPSKDPQTGKYVTDHKGVMHIPAVCGNAEKPFYASGPMKGQWKRKVGVTEENYNTVYQNALNQVTGGQSPAADAGNQTQVDNTANQTNTDQTAQTQSEASQVFEQQTNTNVQGNPNATPNDVFPIFSSLCHGGNPDVIAAATKCFTDAGLANPSLIFSRPDLAPQIHAALLPLAGQGA